MEQNMGQHMGQNMGNYNIQQPPMIPPENYQQLQQPQQSLSEQQFDNQIDKVVQDIEV